MKYKTIEEFIEIAISKKACPEGIRYAKSFTNLKDLFNDLRKNDPHDYRSWLKEHGFFTGIYPEHNFKVDDTVKVIKKSQSFKFGWTNVWVQLMDLSIGKQYEILYDDNDKGILLSNGYTYHPRSLELVERK